ncbi:mycothione reductase [Gephyromycinifex aptenodytis]|uniref:mycothione reductase n=1 Tax=Gephyromycinifex aptenodytis TaxID=2716227 RepID=UPI0014469D68|nr:mycothione reductase [Gephyromycinifex aptenodytis]
MDHVDLAIIGSGSGNSLVTPDFDGRRVAIVESGTFGGTCLNVGCIPTKMFVYAAEVATTIRDSQRYGIDSTLDEVRWKDIRERVFGRIDPIAEGGKQYRLNGENTTAYLGRARFTGPRTLQIALNDGGTALVEADQVVIATGTHPSIPTQLQNTGAPLHTSDTVMRLEELPQRMVIVGGGYIACEFAHVFAALGVQVTLVVRGQQLLRHLDSEISHRFTDEAKKHWDIRFGTEVTDASAAEGNLANVELSDGTTVTQAVLLVATGRAPSTADLDLAAAGVQMHPDGRVKVDAHGRTNVEGVWALGDVSSDFQLKHVANHEARVVAHNLAHPQDLRSFDESFVPAAVFTHPQIATVGATQDELDEQGVDYAVKVQAYGDVAYGWATEDTSGVCKVLADKATGRLLGAHIMGYQASILVQLLVQAMRFDLTVEQVARGQMWIHPALTEVVENALLGLDLT